MVAKSRTEHWAYHNRVKALLKKLGCRSNRIENCAGQDYPDLDCTYQGINFKLEMKIAKGRNGRMTIFLGQRKWHSRELKAGGNSYILAYWVDKDELHLFCLPTFTREEEDEYNESHYLRDYITKIVEQATDLVPLLPKEKEII